MNSIHDNGIKVLNLLLANGGKGSGNWGHAGRPGKVGGSAPGGGATISGTEKDSTPGRVAPKKSSLLKNFEPMSNNDLSRLFKKRASSAPESDKLRVNPNYKPNSGYSTNCQCVVPALEVSMRGYKVKAKERKSRMTSKNLSVFLSCDKNIPVMFCEKHYDGDNGKPAKTRGDELCFNKSRGGVKAISLEESRKLRNHIRSYPDGARIQTVFNFLGSRKGHTVMIVRDDKESNGFYILDAQPQPPKRITSVFASSYFDNKTDVRMLRIDDKPINGTLVDKIMEER